MYLPLPTLATCLDKNESMMRPNSNEDASYMYISSHATFAKFLSKNDKMDQMSAPGIRSVEVWLKKNCRNREMLRAQTHNSCIIWMIG